MIHSLVVQSGRYLLAAVVLIPMIAGPVRATDSYVNDNHMGLMPEAPLPAYFDVSAYPWQAPGEGDRRSPCVFLNTLANHGCINRNGTFIDVFDIATKMEEVFAFSPEYIYRTKILPAIECGQTYEDTTGILRLDLHKLFAPRCKDFHSILVRSSADITTVNQTLLDKLLATDTSGDLDSKTDQDVLTVEDIAFFHFDRIFEVYDLKHDDPTFKVAGSDFMTFETLSLLVLGSKPDSSTVEKDRLSTFLRWERLPNHHLRSPHDFFDTHDPLHVFFFDVYLSFEDALKLTFYAGKDTHTGGNSTLEVIENYDKNESYDDNNTRSDDFFSLNNTFDDDNGPLFDDHDMLFDDSTPFDDAWLHFDDSLQLDDAWYNFDGSLHFDDAWFVFDDNIQFDDNWFIFDDNVQFDDAWYNFDDSLEVDDVVSPVDDRVPPLVDDFMNFTIDDDVISIDNNVSFLDDLMMFDDNFAVDDGDNSFVIDDDLSLIDDNISLLDDVMILDDYFSIDDANTIPIDDELSFVNGNMSLFDDATIFDDNFPVDDGDATMIDDGISFVNDNLTLFDDTTIDDNFSVDDGDTFTIDSGVDGDTPTVDDGTTLVDSNISLLDDAIMFDDNYPVEDGFALVEDGTVETYSPCNSSAVSDGSSLFFPSESYAPSETIMTSPIKIPFPTDLNVPIYPSDANRNDFIETSIPTHSIEVIRSDDTVISVQPTTVFSKENNTLINSSASDSLEMVIGTLFPTEFVDSTTSDTPTATEFGTSHPFRDPPAQITVPGPERVSAEPSLSISSIDTPFPIDIGPVAPTDSTATGLSTEPSMVDFALPIPTHNASVYLSVEPSNDSSSQESKSPVPADRSSVPTAVEPPPTIKSELSDIHGTSDSINGDIFTDIFSMVSSTEFDTAAPTDTVTVVNSVESSTIEPSTESTPMSITFKPPTLTPTGASSTYVSNEESVTISSLVLSRTRISEENTSEDLSIESSTTVPTDAVSENIFVEASMSISSIESRTPVPTDTSSEGFSVNKFTTSSPAAESSTPSPTSTISTFKPSKSFSTNVPTEDHTSSLTHVPTSPTSTNQPSVIAIDLRNVFENWAL